MRHDKQGINSCNMEKGWLNDKSKVLLEIISTVLVGLHLSTGGFKRESGGHGARACPFGSQKRPRTVEKNKN